MSRILLVDDEATLITLLQRYLQRLGHSVTTCTSAQAALDEFASRPQEFDLVITDLTLPKMNGEELLGKIRALNAAIPALIASGYPYEPQLTGVGFLQKPFLPQMLAEEIDKALKGNPRA